MDNIEMAIQKVCASKVYTSAEFKREKDNFQVSTNLSLGRIVLKGQSHMVDICLSSKYPQCKDTIPTMRNKYYHKKNREASVPISTFMCL